MQVFTTVTEMINFVSAHKFKKTMGLVPTMGALHDGHLHLVKKAKSENDLCIVSIFVNPIQFNQQSDFQLYPKSLEQDLKMLKDTQCDIVFVPSSEEVYATNPSIHLNFGNIEKIMEGIHRPGHFRGVAIIISKLLHWIMPDTAYFGKKDYQQWVMIKQLAENLSFQVKIIGVNTVRESNGLAMSSRNRRLSAKALENAAQIYRALSECKLLIIREYPINIALEKAKDLLLNIQPDSIDYFEAYNKNTFEKPDIHTFPSDIAIFVALTLEGVRLIDNLEVNEN